MANKKYNVLSPVIQAGVIVRTGSIDLDEKYAAILVEKGVLEEMKSDKKSDSTAKTE